MSASCAKLIPRQLIGNRKFNVRFKISEDSLFMFSISDRIRIVELADEKAIYFRRIRKDSSFRKKNTFLYEISDTSALMVAYMGIYLSAPFRYNRLLLITRELATLRGFIHRTRK